MIDLASLYIKVDSKGVVTAGRDLDTLTGQSHKAEKATNVLRQSYEKLATVMKMMALATFAAGVGAITYALKKSVEIFSKFEKELANVSTLVNTNIVSMTKLKKELFGLDANLGSTIELTKGLYQALSAGVDSAKAVEFVGKAAMAAKAGLSDTFTAVDAGTTILNAFGISADKATFVYDLMFTTVKEGKTTFSELASSIGRISPIASAAGVSVTEMHAALATLTKGGFKTSEAAARLATALGTIIKPSSEAKKLTEKLGLEFNATALRAKGLHGFLRDVAQATGGNVEQLALLFGGMESLSVMLALTGKQSQEFTDILERMGDVSNATKEAFDKQKVTLIALWDTFKNTISKEAILLGEKLSPEIKEVIEQMTKWLKANRELLRQDIPTWIKAVIDTINIGLTPLRLWADLWQRIGFKAGAGDKARGMDYKKPFEETKIEIKASVELMEKFNKTVEKIPLLELSKFKGEFSNIEDEIKKAEEAAEAFLKDAGAGTWEIMQRQLKELPEVQKEALDKMTKEYDHFYEEVEDSTSDTLNKIFDGQIRSWKDMLGEMKDLFLHTLSDLIAAAIARPIIVPIVASMAGAMGLGSLTGAAGGAGGLGGLGSILGSFGNFLNKPIFGSGGAGAMSSGGFAFHGVNPWTWGEALGGAGMGALGYGTIGQMLGLPQGGYSGIGSALGGGLGSFFGLPGIAAGGALGGLLGSMFGGKKKPDMAYDLTAHLGYGTGGFAGSAGGWADRAEIDDKMKESINEVITAYTDLLNSFLEQVPDSAKDVLKDFDFDFRAFERSTTHIEEAMAQVMDALSQGLAEHAGQVIGTIAPDLLANIKIGSVQGLLGEDSPLFTFYARLQELAGMGALNPEQLTEFLDTLQGVNDTVNAVTEAWDDIEYTMQVAAGTIGETEQQINAIKSQFSDYITTVRALGFAEERLAEIRGYQAAAISRLAESTLRNADAIIKAHRETSPELEAQDWYNEQIAAWKEFKDEISSREYLAGLSKIKDAYNLMLKDIADAAAQEAEDAAKAAAKEAADAATASRKQRLEAERQRLTAINAELMRITDTFDNLLQIIADYQNELLGSSAGALGPGEQYKNMKSIMEEAVKSLYSGNQTTILQTLADLPGIMRDFLSASEAASGTYQDYMSDYNRVMAILNTARSIGGKYGSGIGFAEGGTISGPPSGYSLPVEFHGVEHISTDNQMKAVIVELKEVKSVLRLVLNTAGDINKYTQKSEATLKKWDRVPYSLTVTNTEAA